MSPTSTTQVSLLRKTTQASKQGTDNASHHHALRNNIHTANRAAQSRLDQELSIRQRYGYKKRFLINFVSWWVPYVVLDKTRARRRCVGRPRYSHATPLSRLHPVWRIGRSEAFSLHVNYQLPTEVSTSGKKKKRHVFASPKSQKTTRYMCLERRGADLHSGERRTQMQRASVKTLKHAEETSNTFLSFSLSSFTARWRAPSFPSRSASSSGPCERACARSPPSA